MRGATETLRDGITAAYARDFERARGLLEQAAAAAPESPSVWFWLAISSPSAVGAIRCLQRAIEVDPAHAPAREGLGKLLLAQALAQSDDRPAARALLTQAAQAAPHLDGIWIALADLHDDPSQRLDALRKAVSLVPDRSELRSRLHEALLREAVLCAKTAKVNEARALFREASTINPSDARVWQALARLAEGPAEAADALRQLVKIAPNTPGARESLKKAIAAYAQARAQEKQLNDARALWREAIALDEADPDLWLGLASVLTDQAEVRRAVETACRLNPAHARAAAWLAKLQPRPAPVPAPASRPMPAHAANPVTPFVRPAAAIPARRTVMIVDDSATIRKILAMTLERAGYAVVAEADGERAVERLQQIVPDLILLDITMPKLDGYEVCKHIRKDPRISHVPVVMLSGKDGFFDKVKGRMVGATEYLTKPFQAPAVLAVIASHCPGGPEVHVG